MDWTEEKVIRLRTLVAQNLSSKQIAEKLGGGITRNAVIGKAHRLGLRFKGRAHQSRKQPPRKKKPPQAISPSSDAPLKCESKNNVKPVRKRKSAPNLPDVPQKHTLKLVQGDSPLFFGVGKVPLVDLTNKTCKWPIGGGFCGSLAEGGSSFCTRHANVASSRA